MSVDESGRRSYLPGAWFGVFGDNAAVLLPPTEKRRVAALWELLDDGAGFDEVLDALIATGLRDLPGFVLVADTGDTTRVVVRGDARAEFETADGPVTVEAAGAGTWVERTLGGVTATVLDVSGAADTDEDAGPVGPADQAVAPSTSLTLTGGLVRVSRVTTPAVAAAPAAPAAGTEDTEEAAPLLAAVPSPAPDPEPAPAVEPEPEPIAEPEVDTDPDPDPMPVVVAEDAHPEPGDATEVMSLEEMLDDAPAEPEAPAEAQPEHEAEPEREPEPQPLGWEPAGRDPLDGPLEQPGDQPGDQPPPAPDFGGPVAPQRPQWTPAPAPANPFGPGPGGPAPGGPAEPAAYGDPLPGYDAPPAEAPRWGDSGPVERPAPDAGPDAGQTPGWGDPAPVGEAPPAERFDGDHDGNTAAGAFDPSVYDRQQPGIPGQPQAPSVTARPVARLLMSHGESIDVDRAIVVGRAPEARRFAASDQPRLVTVPSPNQEISSTHLEVRPGSGADHGSAVVTDMGSTNGTVLVQPGLPPEDLQPGVTVQLIPGAVIDLGDGLTIQVANP